MNKRNPILFVLCFIILASCGNAEPTTTPVTPKPVSTATRPRATASPTVPRKPTVWVPKEITGAMRTSLLDAATTIGLSKAETKASAEITMSTQRAPGAEMLMERVYAVVDWYPTKYTSIGSEDLLNLWQGTATP